MFLNLCAGLDMIGYPYRVNDFRYALSHPDESIGIIGKPHLLDMVTWRNPIIFGASVFSHPVDDPDLLLRLPVAKVLVPCEWVRAMFEPHYHDSVLSWPVGIDTHTWNCELNEAKDIDVLVYNKVLWNRESCESHLMLPILAELESRGLRTRVIRYGQYVEKEYRKTVKQARCMIFLCEHETQGIAYQQALSCNVPILAWDRGGCWQDPSYYPTRVRFEPVTSVPYWDDRCGMKFATVEEFRLQFDLFWGNVKAGYFEPRRLHSRKPHFRPVRKTICRHVRGVESDLSLISMRR